MALLHYSIIITTHVSYLERPFKIKKLILRIIRGIQVLRKANYNYSN